MTWYTQWKGTPQDCIDHIRRKHNVGDLVKTASLGKWFPPWTVKRAKVSGISTNSALFSEHGAQLVHHYRVSGDCAAHASLRGSYMVDLLYFTNRACAMHIGRPNAARIRGPGPVRRLINRFRWLDEMLSNVHRSTSLRFTKLLGPSPQSCRTCHHRPALRQSCSRKSTMPDRCHRCVRLRSVGSDRSRLCRFRYCVSPCIVLCRISGSRLRSRLRSTHHRLCPSH